MVKFDFEIDVRNLEADGTFNCPKCSNVISPDDETEEAYTIIENEVKGEELKALFIQCNKCKSVIRLFGFFEQLEIAKEA